MMFEKWLEKQLKAYFNPLVDVVATQEITNKKGNLKSSSDSQNLNNVFHKDNLKEKQNSVQEKKPKKDYKDDNAQFPKTNDLKQTIRCCLCGKSYRLKVANLDLEELPTGRALGITGTGI